MRRVLMLLGSSDVNDSRVWRIGVSLQTIYQVFLFSRSGKNGMKKLTIKNIEVRRFGTCHNSSKNWFKKIFRFLALYINYLIEGIRLKPHFIHAHDLNMLPIGYLLSIIIRAHLVYDSHELWSEQENKKNVPMILLSLVKYIEYLLARRAGCVITVSDSIATKLESDFRISKVWVVQNMPLKVKKSFSSKKESPLRLHPSINPSAFLLLYQGAISSGRGCEVIIHSLKHLPKDIHAVFIGHGNMISRLHETAIHNEVAERVFFLPPVANENLLDWTRGADLGVHPMRGTCLNHKLALPNKLFEYIQAGVPVFVSDMPSMSAFVRQNRLGDVFVDGNQEDFVNKVLQLYNSPKMLIQFAQNCKASSNRFSWESESKKLMEVYRNFDLATTF